MSARCFISPPTARKAPSHGYTGISLASLTVLRGNPACGLAGHPASPAHQARGAVPGQHPETGRRRFWKHFPGGSKGGGVGRCVLCFSWRREEMDVIFVSRPLNVVGGVCPAPAWVPCELAVLIIPGFQRSTVRLRDDFPQIC